MATYAVFGATGKCGSSLIEVLLQSPDTKIHAYCRNAAKLTRMMPEALETKRVQIFEGQIDNVDQFLNCIRGCKAVFLAISMNDNLPGCRVAQDTTTTLLSALGRLRIEIKAHIELPRIVVLSSASLEKKLCHNLPAWFHWVIFRSNSNIFEDLRVQERMLRAEQDWLSTIFIKPGGLTSDKQRGHKLDLDVQETFVSYLDLAAAMVEAADDPDNRYNMKDVSVHNIGGSAKVPLTLPLLVLFGVLRHFFPWLHPYLPLLG
ncbi:hypothetical protein EPUS_06927 [Endocarpon pusillum Z07020]|uniref:NAD(P)-binding domain-containing protein n=1 Tax=Endocarpon pusillum (strain Z07020 / HMAS-L-300199) TaxID=1263415 RepID=U1G8W1_ENDPU|nr:uncharacterized protein EPUS_06927 [Endocarpon pusillum Z07020]ERF68116.1 hypothetical protein EPUS_06927 [Endocarpon pusillum Z07020]